MGMGMSNRTSSAHEYRCWYRFGGTDLKFFFLNSSLRFSVKY